MSENIQFLTVTWAGDRIPFSLLNKSLAMSNVGAVRHDVVVHTEDLQQFEFATDSRVKLLSTADVLPPEVEQQRSIALSMQARVGRRATKLAGSLTRYTGWPRWVRYTGWHTQQLSKLAYVAASRCDTIVILDSDVVITPFAVTEDFLGPAQVVCYESRIAVDAVAGKVKNWQQTAFNLFDQEMPSSGLVDGYYDTPFVMHAPTVRRMLDWLENRYQKHWWEVLIGLPPRRWSEFGCYKCFLRTTTDQTLVDWRSTESIGYLYDASDPALLVREFKSLVEQRHCHYVTIHSQSSGRQRWSAESYQDRIKRELTGWYDAKGLKGMS